MSQSPRKGPIQPMSLFHSDWETCPHLPGAKVPRKMAPTPANPRMMRRFHAALRAARLCQVGGFVAVVRGLRDGALFRAGLWGRAEAFLERSIREGRALGSLVSEGV